MPHCLHRTHVVLISTLAAALTLSVGGPGLWAQATPAPRAAASRAASPAATGSAAVYEPNWARIAELMVHRTLKLQSGERVLIHHDPARDPGLVAALREAIVRAGGIVAGELTWESQRVGAYIDSLPPAARQRRVAAEDSVYRALFAQADVYVWLHNSNHAEVPTRRFEQLIGSSRVRAIHSHWFGPPDSVGRSEVRRMYERAIAVEPERLAAILGGLESKLRGARVRLTAPNGTDLTFTVPADAWFHRNTGDASRAKVATARSIRDREEELPAGVLRTTDLSGVSGRLVATAPPGTKSGAVDVTFRDGSIVKLESRGGAGDWIASGYERATGDRGKPSELVIGANPELRPILPSGFMPYYGYGAGIVRVAIGDNWESGGRNRTSDHWEAWLFVTDGTLTANDVPLIQHGKLVALPR